MPNHALSRPFPAPERVRIDRAFAALRRAGGMTQTGLCCQTCSWAELADRGATDDTTCAIHHVQGTDDAFPEDGGGWMQEPLAIYHSGNSRLVCKLLEAEGLRVEWDGDQQKAIMVLPDLVN